MPERTEIEKDTRYMIAADILSRPLESVGQKGGRRLCKKAANIVELIRQNEELGNSIYATIQKREEEQRARTQNEGIKAFCREYPKYGKVLMGLIEENRIARNKYLVYGLNKGYKLGEEDYIGVMMDLGFERREASAMYPHIIAISERLGKAGETAERSILLKEQTTRKRKKKGKK